MSTSRSPLLSSAVIVSALGYFVDVYDLILFSVVRLRSLKDIGVEPEQLLDTGVLLLNVQMIGMLLGGILWGILGDRAGRAKVLFGSIVMYSIANLCNAFVNSVEAYAFWRFVAGVGLAGELGAGITLVAELLPPRLRGYGTTIVASVGVGGAVLAGVIGELVDWRTAYILGGVMGFMLLLLRISVHESGMFLAFREHQASRPSFKIIFGSPARVLRYLCCITIGLPVWFIIGILVSFAPEMAQALGAPVPPLVGLAVLWCYVGLFFGDVCSGVLSQCLKSRKKALAVFLLLSFIAPQLFLGLRDPGVRMLYAMYALLGFTGGFWVLVVTMSAEQFGTNIRATVTTTVPNFIRGAVVPMTQLFVLLKTSQGVLSSAAYVGGFVSILSLLALFYVKETFGRDLEFVEE
jgi:putative MFS transporter